MKYECHWPQNVMPLRVHFVFCAMDFVWKDVHKVSVWHRTENAIKNNT